MRGAALILCMALAACGARPALVLTPGAAAMPDQVTVFAVSNRAAAEEGGLGGGRARGLFHGRFDVAIPPLREPGQMPVAGEHDMPDPIRHFAVSAAEIHPDAAAFRADLARAIAPTRSAMIFVHGFNNSFANGLFRQAQIVHDLEVPAAAVYFSWPSAANPAGYTYDRDSALLSRSALEQTIRDTRAAGAETLIVIGHSMGAMLVVETLRQIGIREGGDTRGLVDAAVLISPDVDVDLFRQATLETGRLPEPYVIFTSAQDPALRLSSMLTGQRGRLGNLADAAELSELPVMILDVTQFSGDAANSHFTAMTSPLLIHILGQMPSLDSALSLDAAGQPGLLPGTVIGLRRATEIILSPAMLLGD